MSSLSSEVADTFQEEAKLFDNINNDLSSSSIIMNRPEGVAQKIMQELPQQEGKEEYLHQKVLPSIEAGWLSWLSHHWTPWVLLLLGCIIVLIVICIPIYYYVRYRKSIQNKVKEIDTFLSRGLIYRDTNVKKKETKENTNNSKTFRVLELEPNWQEQCQRNKWKLTSMGSYLSSLRLNTFDENEKEEIPKLLQRELQATIGSVFLKQLGPRIGPAVLPMLGIQQIDSWIGQLTSSIISYVASHLMVDYKTGQQWDPTEDRAAFPFAVSELVAFVNLNQKMRSNPSTPEVSPLGWMKRGEIGYDLSYHNKNSPTNAEDVVEGTDDKSVQESKSEETNTTKIKLLDKSKKETDSTIIMDDTENMEGDDEDEEELIPNPFIVEEHFEKALARMEDLIRRSESQKEVGDGDSSDQQPSTYDPEGRSFPRPTPINERILPGLHLGWGDVKCTHTKREILRNRLFAVLLTKLSYNFYCVSSGNYNKDGDGDDHHLFIVHYNKKRCIFPDEFISTLMETGHSIEVCPRSTITTFGIAACIKEADGNWTNIPIGFFLRTGYESKEGRPAYFAAPHGGMDLSISNGPLVKEGTKCDIQFYVAIEGLCGWHSNHNADVPWIESVSTTQVYSREQSLQAIRMAGLLAVTFNSLATDMNLPFGGYGVLGVCNDSAAFIDFAIRGETNMYPLISTGRFLFHAGRRLIELRRGLSSQSSGGGGGNDKNENLNLNKNGTESPIQELNLELAIKDTCRLVTASCNMDSDIHNSPSHLIGATRRYLANSPVSYFQLTEDSKNMMSSVAEIYKEYVHFEGKTTTNDDTADGPQIVSNFVDFLFNKREEKDEEKAKAKARN